MDISVRVVTKMIVNKYYELFYMYGHYSMVRLLHLKQYFTE